MTKVKLIFYLNIWALLCGKIGLMRPPCSKCVCYCRESPSRHITYWPEKLSTVGSGALLRWGSPCNPLDTVACSHAPGVTRTVCPSAVPRSTLGSTRGTSRDPRHTGRRAQDCWQQEHKHEVTAQCAKEVTSSGILHAHIGHSYTQMTPQYRDVYISQK